MEVDAKGSFGRYIDAWETSRAGERRDHDQEVRVFQELQGTQGMLEVGLFKRWLAPVQQARKASRVRCIPECAVCSALLVDASLVHDIFKYVNGRFVGLNIRQ